MNMTTAEILKKICEAPYFAAADSPTLEAIRDIIAPYCEKTEIDAMGNLICTVFSEGEKHVVLSAHQDKIGMVVTGIDRDTGMLKIAASGGVDIRTLPAAFVRVIGKRELLGCITSVPPHLSKGDRRKACPMDSFFVDCGISYDEIKDIVGLGDPVQYYSPVEGLLGDRVTGAYMDDSAGCAAVIGAVAKLKEAGCANRITAVFTTREETGKGGAATAFYRLQPDLALITDVSFGKAPGIDADKCAPLGSGAMICRSPILQKEASELLTAAAREKNIPYTVEVAAGRTATDCDVAVIAGCGVLTGLASIPLLNMHTPVEQADVRDIDAVAQLFFEVSRG